MKKAEYNRTTKRKLKQRQKPIPQVEDNNNTKLKLRSGTINKTRVIQETLPPQQLQQQSQQQQLPQQQMIDDPENGWICSRCSIVNSLDDIECLACGCHRKRFISLIDLSFCFESSFCVYHFFRLQ